MNFLSLFSGIEAASVAWHPLGWKCVGVAEIDPFPCEVLKYHFPNTPNLGSVVDITKEKLDEIKQRNGSIDVVVGGSPCQSFSIAGKRKGLSDPRGNLMFEYCRIVAAVRPEYFVWENVPGALSSNTGRDFACLLEQMAQLGYHLAWRVLDAQFFGVPQRRRRVFLVGSLTNELGAFKVLFDEKGRQRHLEKSRTQRKSNSNQAERSSRENLERVALHESRKQRCGYEEKNICPTLEAAMGIGGGNIPLVRCFTQNSRDELRFVGGEGSVVGALSTTGSSTKQINLILQQELSKGNVVSTLDVEGPTKLSNQWVDSNQQIIETSFLGCDLYNASVEQGNTVGSITTGTTAVSSGPRIIEEQSAFTEQTYESYAENETGRTLSASGGALGHGSETIVVSTKVRRLTPLECERLQGFPDGWTQISWKGKSKEECPTGHRYKALGNSMAVPVMKWIGEGINYAEENK